MRAWHGAVSAGLLMALAPAALAQEAGQARAYLENGMAAHAERGYAPERTTPDLVTSLVLDRAFLWPIYLRAGVNYRVYAACDNACSDIDMEIYAADGQLADRDIATNDTPYVQITPTQTGRAYVRLWVFQCTAPACAAAARVVAGGRPALREAPAESGGEELSGGPEAAQ